MLGIVEGMNTEQIERLLTFFVFTKIGFPEGEIGSTPPH